MKSKVLIFIVTYNAEKTIHSVLNRIPESIFSDARYDTEILIVDDGSKDQTFYRGVDYKEQFPQCPLTVLKNPINLGYGGNQKVGYRYAIDKGFDHVVLLHGDGQYAPEELPKLLEPLISGTADVVFGSRMMEGFRALKGGMPLYKFVGNKILTFVENMLVGSRLSEYHSGFRLYSTKALKRIPFESNPNGFEFDTDIIIQLHASGAVIKELPIPTFYGDEICHVNGLQYAMKIVISCLLFRIQRFGIFYDPKFDVESGNTQYTSKFDFLSSHSLALAEAKRDDVCLLLGCGPYPLVEPFLRNTKEVDVVDQYLDQDIRTRCAKAWLGDLDQFSIPEETQGRNYSKVFALDVIEHLKSPEQFLAGLRDAASCSNAELIITTPNVAFLPIRLMLFLGSFNYGKRGILDRTHTRLFTRKSLRRVLLQAGYTIEDLRGIPGPYPLALGRNAFSEVLLALNAALCKIIPGLVSYQLFVRCRPNPTAAKLLRDAVEHSADALNQRSQIAQQG